MFVKAQNSLKITAAVAAGLIALTGCTTASQDTAENQPAGASAFDLSTVAKDDALAAEVPAAISSKGTLIVGSDTTYAPAEFLGGNDGQTPMGYDVDMAKAIGATLGLKVEVKTADFTGIIPSLGPKYDLGISSFFITEERSKAATFVSYFQAGTQWVTQKGNPKSIDLEDLCGKTVGVQTGTFQEDPDISGRSAKCVSEGKSAINVVSLKKQTDVTTRLVNGGLDAMAAGSITTAYAITQTEGSLETIGTLYGASPLGIAVDKNDTKLADVVAKAVNKLIADGSYKKILDTWGNGDGAIAKAEVNPAVDK
ncbi:ABC transporter substrate-binding protein [Arthrobacter psychrolactophilus]|uniref:ABC transporter substrate-binding protein n=1 Tax=Arthrobacter psychrolactophilus TaxID=92442 RepID=A0A2V5JJ99_9MICC|nr:ABC transporter substrate-binding protein [Arthrobacter psychrolactophilus]PYI37206.1 ABC transporter substrate-binding protein [Arthrobacter psychrolactophilus]